MKSWMKINVDCFVPKHWYSHPTSTNYRLSITRATFLSNHIPELNALRYISGDLGQLSHLSGK
jgi:hypothetical protein